MKRKSNYIHSNSRARDKSNKRVRANSYSSRSTNEPNASESEIVFGCRSTSSHALLTSVLSKTAKARPLGRYAVKKTAAGKQSVKVLQNAPIIERAFCRSSTEIFEGLTDFERTLAVICMGWLGQERGWKQYIKDNADVLLRIAIKNLIL